jgi:hypothetical protein
MLVKLDAYLRNGSNEARNFGKLSCRAMTQKQTLSGDCFRGFHCQQEISGNILYTPSTVVIRAFHCSHKRCSGKVDLVVEMDVELAEAFNVYLTDNQFFNRYTRVKRYLI